MNAPSRPLIARLTSGLIVIIALQVAPGCRTVPPGTPPEGVIVTPPTVAGRPLSAKAAVNHMVTALVTRCPEIGSAGGEPPAVTNAFQVADRAVNQLPMDVWQCLIRMRLIRPVPPDSPTATYRLESELQRAPDLVVAPDLVAYRWVMCWQRLSPDASGKCWREEVTLAVPATSPGNSP